MISKICEFTFIGSSVVYAWAKADRHSAPIGKIMNGRLTIQPNRT
jgi:hypothetical protein